GGHSYIAGEEIFYRAGGLVPVNAILDPGVSLAPGAIRSTKVERTPGYAKAVLDTYALEPGDVILVVNANGINSVTIDAALEAKTRGLTVIAVTSPECSRNIPAGHPARHPSNQDLCDVADVFIDSKVPVGEALVSIEGCDQKVGPASTITNAFILHSMVVAAVEHMVSVGVKPPVWKSANAPGGDEANRQYIAEYSGRVKHL
ncbi:MAG: sugar isomerase domain-containing protein, partial [Anaerolineae bacterium]|nr:sugar isomerase domain-containing protein [Anaerolineae bacterium]NIQ77746.1 sugar isomerase domain-containing protein [Anaerolineae bacterium]